MALTKEAVAGGLGGLGKSPITLKHAYLTLQVAGNGVSDISVLRQYPHLQVRHISLELAPLSIQLLNQMNENQRRQTNHAGTKLGRQ